MKRALLKDSIKEIKKTYKRFISLLLMAFLGVGFFAGIKATSPDMVDTIDKYYKEQNVYDIEVISTLGLTNNDIQELAKIENIETVYGTYEVDGKIEIENKEVISKIMCIEEVNKPVILEGNLPQNANECVVEQNFLSANNMKIGDIVEVEIEDTTNDDGDELPYLKQKELKIVGTVKTPLYISADRGTTNLGAGKINYYMYISKENINATDVYTHIYMKVKDSDNYTTSSDEYEDYIEEVKQNVENIKEERENARRDELVAKATIKVQDAENELNQERQEAQEKIDEAEKEIEKGKQEIKDAENKISTNQSKAQKEFASAQKQIDQAQAEITKNEEELKQKEKEANKQFTELEKQKQDLASKLTSVDEGIAQVNEQYNQTIEALKNPQLPEEQKVILEQTKSTLEVKKQELEKNKSEITAGITQIENGITQGKQELENGKTQIEKAKQEIAKQQTQLTKEKKKADSQIVSAKSDLEKAKVELQEGEEELNKNKQEFNEKIVEAEGKLIDAKAKIDDIEKPEWYVLDRYANIGYNGFTQDAQSIANIGQVFPVIFFIIATLISLNSMTRMVEEQRTQIGTLKALGYSKAQIASKYVIYASLACIIGAVLGMCVGFIIIPKIIWMMYQQSMYDMGEMAISFNTKYGIMGLILISVCIIGATVSSAIKELNNTPATLMRPKAPKMGKRVLLEKIPFIWKRLSFSSKVTIRNMFRYKKRFLMTIIGITGCTAMIVAGFGLKDSIGNILPSQYEKVFNYDMQINLKNALEQEQKQAFIEKINNREEIVKALETYMKATSVINKENTEDVQIIVPKNPEDLDGTINLIDVKTKQKVELQENEICITDKVAQLLGVKQGDIITLQEDNESSKQLKISNIVENYISHYVYITPQTYQNLYGEEYSTNVILTQNIELNEEEENTLATQIMQENEVAGITRNSSNMKILDDTLSSLNYVVVVLIVAAGLLAFVVLYNLSNVNISERIRELATIKVLGFYDKEVYSYVTKETILLTIIGIGLGLIAGFFLNSFLITTCETNMLRFGKYIKPISYVYAILITTVFTMIVNFVTYFALKKIDMIESLKSVE